MIPFNRPCVTGKEREYIQEAIGNAKLSGNGPFGRKCCDWLEDRLGTERALLTPSCTHALEMTALLAGIQEGDEVILPSYTFVSTANAFVLQGAKLSFIDVEPNTMNMDVKQVESAVTKNTKAIVVVHYAGVCCDMERIMTIAEKYDLLVIEDAAQSLLSSYRGRPLGTIGHFGTLSFHETKNYTCGEGGALLINDKRFIDRAEIIQEKGTNRSQFLQGRVDKYTWRDVGSSYLLSDLNAAYLYAQLEHADEINMDRKHSWEIYRQSLEPLAAEGKIELPYIPEDCMHNAHMFYIKTRGEQERKDLVNYLSENDIMAVPHYVPLHSSVAGEKYGDFVGKDSYTTKESVRLLRLPLYYRMGEEVVGYVVEHIRGFYKK
ncbi:dTDP-4-amino-4,6-dideoxygalactose transaminase [Thalassobacillus pellis]|uniref:dTDP-4-amino-4,6-dideoxygalactose transaminase n=1 Tax=Thalassobacillus pellis TaxID=748008 RepID=UPI00196110B7|nr:dTDP-4-amino-4,6-dideoxygalactose transaminase [Thalassobacillus pellis]MBM7553807.1 dTDP-4-amino-4,6-dideoxygalactose transaminase [Thalassobacillus pellis]